MLIKKHILFVSLILFVFCFIHWYLSTQQVIPDMAISFYQKYAQFNQISDENFYEGMQMFLERMQADSRNMIYALALRPFWLIFGKSFEVYVMGILVFFGLPTIFIASKFINKYALNNCSKFKLFKAVVPFLIATTPLFLYTILIGYPDIFSIGLVVLSIFYFVKAEIYKKTDLKNLAIFTTIFFASFLFRRWIFFVWVCFLLSSAIFYTQKILFSNIQTKEKISNLITLIKNLTICLITFFILFAIFAQGVLHDMFDPKFKSIFQDYTISYSQNFLTVIKWGNPWIYSILAIYLIFFTKTSRFIKKFFKKNTNDKNQEIQVLQDLQYCNEFFSFFALNAIIFFTIFNYINIICYDHAMWIIFCGLVCFLVALYSIISALPNKKILTAIVIIISLLNLSVVCTKNDTDAPSIMGVKLFTSNYISPKSVPNLKILKETEKIIQDKYEENPNFHYSIWCFWNDIYNPHLIFQSAYDIDLFNKGIFPPLVDTESIVSDWYFLQIIVADTIFVLEPTQDYLPDKDKCKILSKTQELIKNKQGFGSAFVLKDKKFLAKSGNQDVYLLQYDRIRPATKADYDDYKSTILALYPWANDYFPDTFPEYFEKLFGKAR